MLEASIQGKGQTVTPTPTTIEAFERLLRFFTLMAYFGGVVIVVGVGLGIALSPNGWGWTSAFCAVGAISVAVGVRERIRGRKILARLRGTNIPT
jgi:hypothetical protein